MLEVNAKQYAHKGNKQIVERGFQYFTYGKIIDYSYDDKSKRFTFIIEGNSNYKVALKLNDDRSNIIASACSCPYDNKLCKHEIAAAFWLSENASNKEIFKKSKSIFSRGTKVTIKNARNLSHYKLTELLDQQRIRNDEDSNIENFIITELSNNKFDIFLELLVGHYFNQRAEEQNLFISRDKDHLKVECSCSERVQSNKVCSHVFLFFEKVINDQAMNIFFNSEIDKETEEKLYELVEQFGFDKSKGWKEYFEVAYSGFEKAFQLNKKYENYLNISALSRIEPKEILYSNYEEELNELENSLPSQKLQFGFYLLFNSYNLNVTINAFTGRSNKQGVPMSISYRPHNSYDWHNSKFLSSSEELIIQYAEKVNSEENIQSTLKYLNKALAILENHPYVFLNEGTNPNHFYKSDLKKIDLVIGAPQIIYGLESKNDKVVSSVKVVSNRKKYSISDKEVVRLHPHFVKIKECIYFLPNIVESSHFEAAQLVHNKIMVLSKMPDFIEKYLLNVLKKYDFEVSKNSPIKVKNKELKMKQKELYLSEVGGFIVFRPFIQYENDIRLNALTEKSEWTYKDKKLIQKKGDEVEVEEFKSLIKSLHPEFEQQLRSDYLHLRGTELLKNNMFFDFFKKLKEHNVKVFGLEKLSQLKVNPYPGKVSYSVKSGIDWFEVEASVVFGDAEISIEDLKKRFVPGSSYVELNDGTKGMLPDEWVKKLEKLFRHGNLKEGRIKISNKKFNLIDELFEELDDELSAEIFEKKEKLIHFNGFKEQKVPKGIKAELRDYQKAGYSWLNFLKDFGWGGILADDMGLGKTLQAITFIKQIIATDKTPNLIIVPTSLLFNWKNELEKFAPSIKAHFYYGPQRDKDIQAFNKYHLIITSYGHLVSDIEHLKEFEFNYVILDESQAIKNPASKRFKAARLLKAKNRVAMTGTPIENNTFDLYAQMSFLNPGFLGSQKHFKDTFAKAIDRDRDEEKANELQKMIKPFVLRRTKEQVATELPDKTEEVLYCEMDASQRKIYDSHRNEFRNKIINQIEEEGINKSRFMVLEGLTRLRQICDSPNILAGEDKYDGKSVKIDLLLEHILEKTANHKILVFSQFVSMLNEIKRELDKHNIEYAYLDGKSNTKNREQNVANFQNQENCRVFLISLKAGGTGLNLMAADYVYIVDPWWNPAVENQAIDRCYRIGQKKNVIAYRMICKDTVEEKIVELQNKKKAIAGDIISTDEGVLKKLEKDDLMELFS